MMPTSFISDLYVLLLRETSGDKTAFEAIHNAFDLRPAEDISEFLENMRDLEAASNAVFIELITRLGHSTKHIWSSSVHPEMDRPWYVHENGTLLTRCSSESELSSGSMTDFVPVKINPNFPRTDCGGVTVIYWLTDASNCNDPEHTRNASVLSTAREIKK